MLFLLSLFLPSLPASPNHPRSQLPRVAPCRLPSPTIPGVSPFTVHAHGIAAILHLSAGVVFGGSSPQ